MQGAEKNNYQPKILYLAKLTFKNEEKIKTSKYKQKADSSSLLDLPYKKMQKQVLQLKKKKKTVNNIKSCKNMKMFGKGKYIDKYRIL